MRTFSVPVRPLDLTGSLARCFSGQMGKLSDFPVFRHVLLTVTFHHSIAPAAVFVLLQLPGTSPCPSTCQTRYQHCLSPLPHDSHSWHPISRLHHRRHSFTQSNWFNTVEASFGLWTHLLGHSAYLVRPLAFSCSKCTHTVSYHCLDPPARLTWSRVISMYFGYPGLDLTADIAICSA